VRGVLFGWNRTQCDGGCPLGSVGSLVAAGRSPNQARSAPCTYPFSPLVCGGWLVGGLAWFATRAGCVHGLHNLRGGGSCMPRTWVHATCVHSARDVCVTLSLAFSAASGEPSQPSHTLASPRSLVLQQVHHHRSSRHLKTPPTLNLSNAAPTADHADEKKAASPPAQPAPKALPQERASVLHHWCCSCE
jgi:hypothetical protein